MKKALITRYGGIGDGAPLTTVAHQLKKRGYSVTLAIRSDGPKMRIAELFAGHPDFDEVLDLIQVGPWNTRCVVTPLGLVSVQAIYHQFDLVLDYMYCIENNSTSPYCDPKTGNEWMYSRNSNWVNWHDLHLAWANINPKSVPPEEKRPTYYLIDEEKKQAQKLREGFDKVVVIQTNASAKSRTWYHGDTLAKRLLKEYPNAGVYLWDDSIGSWVVHSKQGERVITVNSNPLRFTMLLIYASDLFIGADTGFSHVAEGLEKQHIAIYSTVPWWTRAQYFKYQTHIDHGEDNPEFYTFSLKSGDPLRIKEFEDSLTEREKKLLQMFEAKVPIQIAAKELGTDPQGVDLELKAVKTREEAFNRMQSKALSSVTVDEVFEKAKGLLDAK